MKGQIVIVVTDDDGISITASKLRTGATRSYVVANNFEKSGDEQIKVIKALLDKLKAEPTDENWDNPAWQRGQM